MSWCDGAQTASNPEREISSRTSGPNFYQWSLCNRAQTEGSGSRVKNAIYHHAQAFFFSFCHGCRRRAKQSPEVSIIRLRPRGQEKSHYICCHTKSLSRCGGENTQRLWCDAGDPEIPQMPHGSPRLQPSCHSNERDTFHSGLRRRKASLISFVLTKLVS